MNKLPPIALPKITVDVAIFTIKEGMLHALLLRRPEEPFSGMLALPGGFMWEGETTHDSAIRVLSAKVNAKDIFIEQLYTFDALERDPRERIMSVAYFALVPYDTLTASGLTAESEIVPVGTIKTLAFDHDAIVARALIRLRNKLSYSTIAYSVLPKLFTLSQLQQAYEAILGKTLDKRNFRKKITSLGIIEQTNKKTAKAAHRPAVLFKFARGGYAELEQPIF